MDSIRNKKILGIGAGQVVDFIGAKIYAACLCLKSGVTMKLSQKRLR
jgi:hypothetical protein